MPPAQASREARRGIDTPAVHRGPETMWRRYGWVAGALAANAALWVVPSDVVELVARDRDTLLGRYSREHFAWILVTLAASGVLLYVRSAPIEKRRGRWFQVIAVVMMLAPTLTIADYLLRRPQRVWYVHDSPAYHRLPNDAFSVEFRDQPLATRTYPIRRPGHPPVTCAYHTDDWGFRNHERKERYDIIAVGDSFTEGSGVSDGDAWPVRLAASSGWSVYNLGMSGYAPLNYVAAVEKYGLSLRPSIVLCMLYEGNDFRSDDGEAVDGGIKWGDRLRRYWKQSPIRTALDELMIETFGSIGAGRNLDALEVLSWLPIAIPPGPDARYYAFAPKQMLETGVDAEAFQAGPQWTRTAGVLMRMRKRCGDVGATLVIVHAATKAAITLPLVRDRLPMDDVRAFAALRADSLPPSERFEEELFARLPAREAVVRQWAADHEIPFISTTDTLRSAVADGVQVFYTYDQHWTPVGHALVAEKIRQSLIERGLAEGDASPIAVR